MNIERIKNRFWSNHREIKDAYTTHEIRNTDSSRLDYEIARIDQYKFAKRLLSKMTEEQLVSVFTAKWVPYVKRWIGAELILGNYGEYVKLAK